MIVNHVFIGRGNARPADLFNVLTWASIGATVNIYVANPDKRAGEVQHTYASLFNQRADLGEGAPKEFKAERLFEPDGERSVAGLADRVRLINLHDALDRHDALVPQELRSSTVGWKNGIVKFLGAAGEWWPAGTSNGAITERIFTTVDATKFYLAATREGLVCDMKVAPTPYFSLFVDAIRDNFISFQRGNAGATGFENQLSGSMCALTAEPRVTYATEGKATAEGFGGKTVDEAARYFEKITAAHGKAMNRLVQKRLGVHSTELSPRKPVFDPQSGWTGPVCVFKHPKDQSWVGRTLSDDEKEKGRKEIENMAEAAVKMVRKDGTLGDRIPEAMVELRSFPGFNLYA